MSAQDESDDDLYSPVDTEGDYDSSPEGEDVEYGSGTAFPSLRIATVTCLHKYAIARMEGAQNESLPWPPLMLVILSYLNKRYSRRELVTERNIAMLELLLRVPIQLLIKRGEDEVLDLNEDRSLDYSGMSFSQSLEILRDLIEADVVKLEDVRVPSSVLRKY